MESPELFVVALNFTLIATTYFWFYPKFCGSDVNKIIINDFLASATAVFIVGLLYWDSATEFNMFFTTANWFWFTLITYLIIETPLMLRYFKKYDVWSTFDP
jgi:hypothetical protein